MNNLLSKEGFENLKKNLENPYHYQLFENNMKQDFELVIFYVENLQAKLDKFEQDIKNLNHLS